MTEFAAFVQGQIDFGRGQVARVLGYNYAVYRCAVANNPITSGHLLHAALLVSPTQKGRYNAPNTFGNSIWWSYHDGTQTQPGDYLVGRGSTFYVASQQDLLQIQLVQCNRVLTFSRVAEPSGAGFVGYAGETASDTPTIMQNWPASVLQGSKGEHNPTGLPLDVKNPWWLALLPAVSGVKLLLGDTVTDEDSNTYWIHQAELTDLGWRLKLMQVQP